VQSRDPDKVVLQVPEPLVRSDHFLDVLLEYPTIGDVLPPIMKTINAA
jgi:hypothetical protein